MRTFEQKQSELSLLAEHENCIAELYRIYAQTFPELKDFWEALAAEEQEHAAWVQTFAEQLADGAVSLIGCRFNPEAIVKSIEYLKGRALAAPLEPLYHAFTTSLDIENSLLESKFYEVANDATPQTKKLLASLVEAAREHHHRLQARARQYAK